MRKKLAFGLVAILITSILSGCSKTVDVTSIKMDKTSLEIEVGSSEKINVTIEPTNATNQEVEWSSNDNSIITVDNTGMTTAVSKGTAVITVKTKDGKHFTVCNVNVIGKKVEGIKLDKETASLEEGKSQKLTVSIDPVDAENKKVIWTSSNEKVATVDENGVVKAIISGTSEIIAKAEDGNFLTKCLITVKSKPKTETKATNTTKPSTAPKSSSTTTKPTSNKKVLFKKQGPYVQTWVSDNPNTIGYYIGESANIEIYLKDNKIYIERKDYSMVGVGGPIIDCAGLDQYVVVKDTKTGQVLYQYKP